MTMTNDITFEDGSYGRKAVIQSDWTTDTAKYLVDHGVVEIELNMAKGWKAGSDLSFLSEVPFLKSFEIVDFHTKDISPIHFLRSLRRIEISTYCSTAIDFSAFPDLEECVLEWRPKATSVFACTTLKKLFVNRYKGKNCDSFSSLVNLESLSILNAPVANLYGLKPLTGLRFLRLANLRQLTSLEGIECLTELENLTVDTCRKISSIGEIVSLTSLRTVDIDNDGDIASIKPMEKLDKLERVGFVESTNVLDGDLTPFLRLRHLSRISFQNRKHYSHTREELNARFSR